MIIKDTIACSKFTLRKLRPVEDKKSIIENINDKNVLKNLYFDFPYTEDNYKNLVSGLENEKIENSSLNYVIDVNGQAVGSIRLHWRMRPSTIHAADFNYWLGKKYWGQGIMTEAVKVLCDYAFNELNKLKLSIIALEDNIGSRKVAEKNGFKFECMTEKDVFKEGKYKNLVYYGKFNPKYKVINEK